MHRLMNKRIECVTHKGQPLLLNSLTRIGLLISCPDYDNVASEVERLLIKLSEARERRAREATYLQNRADVAEHHQRLRSKQPRLVLPPLGDFRRLSIIQILQGTSPATVEYPVKQGSLSVSATLLKETWVIERLNTELRQWRENAKKDLGTVLGFPNWKTASSKVLHPVERLTARFLCKSCDSKLPSRFLTDGCLDFAGACAHVCFPKKKAKKVEGTWTADDFVKDERAIAAVKKLLTLCNADESLSEASLKFAAQHATIMCTTCQPAIILDSYGVVRQ
ncbi:hypothetical protein H0H87_007844 [Tephrocybe sp. NHM501043]|nr:hypothetical protein H0H87_007844 [Tephrocybe sp. NHM501043]